MNYTDADHRRLWSCIALVAAMCAVESLRPFVPGFGWLCTAADVVIGAGMVVVGGRKEAGWHLKGSGWKFRYL